MKARFRDRISALLCKGYGAEDIAIRLKCAPELVRREITRLREEGRLRDIVRPRASDEPQNHPKTKRPGAVLPTPTGPDRSA